MILVSLLNKSICVAKFHKKTGLTAGLMEKQDQ